MPEENTVVEFETLSIVADRSRHFYNSACRRVFSTDCETIAMLRRIYRPSPVGEEIITITISRRRRLFRNSEKKKRSKVSPPTRDRDSDRPDELLLLTTPRPIGSTLYYNTFELYRGKNVCGTSAPEEFMPGITDISSGREYQNRTFRLTACGLNNDTTMSYEESDRGKRRENRRDRRGGVHDTPAYCPPKLWYRGRVPAPAIRGRTWVAACTRHLTACACTVTIIRRKTPDRKRSFQGPTLTLNVAGEAILKDLLFRRQSKEETGTTTSSERLLIDLNSTDDCEKEIIRLRVNIYNNNFLRRRVVVQELLRRNRLAGRRYFHFRRIARFSKFY